MHGDRDRVGLRRRWRCNARLCSICFVPRASKPMNRWRGTRLPLLPRDFCKPGSSNGRRPLSLTAAASLPLARDCELTYLIDMAEIQPLDRLGPTVDAPPLGPGPQPVHVSSPLEALEAKGTPAAAAPQHFRERTDCFRARLEIARDEEEGRERGRAASTIFVRSAPEHADAIVFRQIDERALGDDWCRGPTERRPLHGK